MTVEQEEEEEKSARLSVTLIFSSSPFTHRVYVDGSDIVPHSLFALTFLHGIFNKSICFAAALLLTY
jgi:hypothetical protein